MRGTRSPHQENPRLEALLDRRDHVRVQISLLLDAERRDYEQLRTLQRELAELDAKIARYK